MQIFAGSSNQDLAKKIAGELGEELGRVEISRFENGEARIRISEAKVEHKAVLVQSLSRPVDEQVVEFCLLADALTRKGVTELTGVIPWLGYSKQDKVFQAGEALAAKVMAQILQTTKVKNIFTFDLHNLAILGFFDIPVSELSAKPLFLDYFKKRVNEHTVVVAPDEGAVKASAYFARELKVPIVYMDKSRDLKTGKVEVAGMSGSVKEAEVLIMDDMIVTGSTLIETARYLKSKGAKSVSAAATHHLYVPGVQEKLEASAIDEIVVTDTVAAKYTNKQMTNVHKWAKLKILSVAGIIAGELT